MAHNLTTNHGNFCFLYRWYNFSNRASICPLRGENDWRPKDIKKLGHCLSFSLSLPNFLILIFYESFSGEKTGEGRWANGLEKIAFITSEAVRFVSEDTSKLFMCWYIPKHVWEERSHCWQYGDYDKIFTARNRKREEFSASPYPECNIRKRQRK